MTFRDEERAKAKAAAALEPLNKNGMHRDTSPPSTRNVAEAKQILPDDPEPATRDHTTAAGTTSVQYPSSVRSRLESDRPLVAAPVMEEPYPYGGSLEERQAYWLRREAEKIRRKHGKL